MVILVTGAMIAVGEWMHLVYKSEEHSEVSEQSIQQGSFD
jgi:hypothetical protein